MANLPRNIVDYQHADRTAEVATCHGLEAFLACRVPDLYFNCLPVNLFVLHAEFDTNCVFSARIDCAQTSIDYVSNQISNKSEMSSLHFPRKYQFKMQDFPTPVSPMIMNLNRQSTFISLLSMSTIMITLCFVSLLSQVSFGAISAAGRFGRVSALTCSN